MASSTALTDHMHIYSIVRFDRTERPENPDELAVSSPKRKNKGEIAEGVKVPVKKTRGPTHDPSLCFFYFVTRRQAER